MRKFVAGLVVPFCAVLLMSCDEKKANSDATFTKADSLTDRYLAFQDSMLQSWNVMINDDNQKIKSMHNLLHELLVISTDERDQITKFEEQLDQLTRLRYTQKSMGNADVVEEYDFASTALVRELISLAETTPEFANNPTLQKLVEDIRLADERVNNYRDDYDLIVLQYNEFLDENKSYLLEANRNDSLEKRYLFQMVSVE
ncbi:MAG TPA: LemA family protein [Chryseolinea sp.]